MKKHGKTLSDLVRGANVSQPTARSYVEGTAHARWDHDVLERIEAWTGGSITKDQLKGAA